MSVERRVERGDEVCEDRLEGLGIEPHQLASAKNPEMRICEIIASRDAGARAVRAWAGEPRLAKAVRERLARAVHVRLG